MSLFSATDPATPVARALVVTPVFESMAATGHASPPDARLDEAVRLARGIGVAVAHAETVALSEPKAISLFGRRGMERLGGLMEAFRADLLIVDHPLTPLQQRTLERGCLAKVVDRCALILEALSTQAGDAETRMQADLAAFQFQRGRMIRCWSRPGDRREELGFQTVPGGIPGDTLLESHRRRLTERIAGLKRDLADLRRARARHRAEQRAAGCPTVALIGHAGAGVATLAARLRGTPSAGAAAEATLPSGRRVELTTGVPVLADLPRSVAVAFAATLDAVRDADLILHVRDASDPDSGAHAKAVDALLDGLGIDPATDPRLLEVLTKADRLAGTARAALAMGMLDRADDGAVIVSAVTGMGLDELASRMDQRIGARMERRFDRTGPAPLLETGGPTLA